MSLEQEIRKGIKVSRRGLLDQSRVHIGLEEMYRAQLANHGWAPELTQKLVENTALVDSEMAATIEARFASKDHLAREQAAITEAKGLKSDLTHAFRDLFADGAVTHAELAAVRGHGALDRVTSKISAYLTEVEPVVRAHDDALRPYFHGESAHAGLVAAKAELDAAQSVQELGVAHLPDETKKVYLAKATVLSLIEKMNRIAKIAFKGQAEIIGRFNKDLILRARQGRKPGVAAEAAPAEATPEATKTAEG